MYVVDGKKSPTGFDPIAHAQHIPFMSNELGGGDIDREAIRIGYLGARNVLGHLNLIAASESANTSKSSVYLDAVNGAGGVLAPFEGLFEAQFDVGDTVESGQTAGILYSLDEVDRPPKELLFTDSGIVCVKSTTARVVQGSHICMTAKAVARGEVLALADT
jgi:predicted deacylase